MSENNLPQRKSNRLSNYDYSQNGCYFVTVCSDNKKFIFGRYNVGAIHESPAVKMPSNRFILLNSYGKTVDGVIKQMPNKFSYVKIDNYIVMPNHIHLLITINRDEASRAIRESPLQRSLLSNVIGYLKATVSKEIHKRSPDLKIWQRGFYEHVVRNQKDYENAWQYIEYNALKEHDNKKYGRTI